MTLVDQIVAIIIIIGVGMSLYSFSKGEVEINTKESLSDYTFITLIYSIVMLTQSIRLLSGIL